MGPDHPTTGGYPVIGVIADVDTDRLAQARPGSRVRLIRCRTRVHKVVPMTNGPIVWIDCEMTGLDIVNDALVEVACIVTDEQLVPVDDGIDVIIAPSRRVADRHG